MRIAPLLTFLALAALLVALLAHKMQPATPGTVSTHTFPALTLRTLDGEKTWNPSALTGQVTLVNFFASWCTPCATEMPELEALRQQFPSLRMEGIAWNDTPEILRPWLKKHGDPFHHLWLDKTGESAMMLGIKGIPESFLIDKKGVIRYRIAAPITPQVREGELATMIRTLLAEESPDAP